MRRVEVNPEQLALADAVVLLTNHDQFDFDIVQHARSSSSARVHDRGGRSQ
jgi:hypothetical protein